MITRLLLGIYGVLFSTLAIAQTPEQTYFEWTKMPFSKEASGVACGLQALRRVPIPGELLRVVRGRFRKFQCDGAGLLRSFDLLAEHRGFAGA